MQARRPQTCHRCKTTKFSKGLGGDGNHKVASCADGAKIRHTSDPPPPFPQPNGVFSDGMYFHPNRFLAALHEMNEHQVAAVTSGIALQDVVLPMELAQFRTMVQTREFVRYGDNGKKITYFRLYDYLTCSPPCSDLIELHNGLRYLRLDCLADD